MAAQIIFSSFFIFTASRWFLTGSHRTADGPPHILKKITNLLSPLDYSTCEMPGWLNLLNREVLALEISSHPYAYLPTT
jgi:hypothetical protein